MVVNHIFKTIVRILAFVAMFFPFAFIVAFFSFGLLEVHAGTRCRGSAPAFLSCSGGIALASALFSAVLLEIFAGARGVPLKARYVLLLIISIPVAVVVFFNNLY